VSQHTSHEPAGGTPAEAVFVGTSQWRLYFPILFGWAAAAWFAFELGLREWLPDLLGVHPVDSRMAAGSIAGVLVFAFAVITAIWFGRLRWVGVSAGGIRWFRGMRIRTRGWGEFSGIKRTVAEAFRQGEVVRTVHGAEVVFHTGRPMVISPLTISDYEGLIAAIEAEAKGRAGLGGGSSFGGLSVSKPAGWAKNEGVQAFGPLKIHLHGVEWDRVVHPWDQVDSYELHKGMLLIQAADGKEFLRRVADLGDWRQAMERLGAAIGEKQIAPAVRDKPAKAGGAV
jgi:hypothetical protein